MSGGRGFGGNREVPPLPLLSVRGDLSAAWAEAILKEGGAWGKHGFPHGSEPKANDAHARTPAPSFSMIASATSLVPTAVGSLRVGFMSYVTLSPSRITPAIARSR